MAKAKKPDDWVVGGTPQSFEIYGCMVRTGRYAELAQKWVGGTAPELTTSAVYR